MASVAEEIDRLITEIADQRMPPIEGALGEPSRLWTMLGGVNERREAIIHLMAARMWIEESLKHNPAPP